MKKQVIFFLFICWFIIGCSSYPKTTAIHDIPITIQTSSAYENQFLEDIKELPDSVRKEVVSISIENIPRSYTQAQKVHLSATSYAPDMVLHEALHAWFSQKDTGFLEELMKGYSMFNRREVDESLVEIGLWYLQNPDGMKKEMNDLYEALEDLKL